jgi:ABC-type multidrug transport system fused ATPase/permease subunit
VVIGFATLAVGRAIAIIPNYSKGKMAAIRIMRLNKRPSEIDPSDRSGIVLVRTIDNSSIDPSSPLQDEIVGKVEFQNVYFRYPSRPTVRILRKFSLKCLSKMTTEFVGSSGSGKSTTIALLERFYDPCKGKILLDGHDIKVLNLQWLRSMIGLVQQEPVLFNLSIRENIAYGDNTRQLTQQHIEQAVQILRVRV